MTAFIGASEKPHVGQCQNFFTNRGYCLEPVLALGAAIPTDRDICQKCRADTLRFRERLTASYVKSIRSGDMAEWVARSRAHILDLHRWYGQRAADGASLEDLYRINRDIELRQGLLNAVLAG